MKKILLFLFCGLFSLSCLGQSTSAGAYQSLFLCSDSTARACGDNYLGELGNPSVATQSSSPVVVIGLGSINSVSGGSAHSLFLKSDNTVWACGRNVDGELGDGTNIQRNTVVPLASLSGIVKVYGTNGRSFFLKSDGTVWSCGFNIYGQLGDGTTTHRNSPVQVIGITGIIAVGTGYAHTLFLKNDGTVWVCGQNGFGQFGNGTTGIGSSIAVQVPALTGVVAISAGGQHSLFLKNNGTVWACGNNFSGQLGDGTTTDRYTPIQVPGLTGIIGLDGGYDHSVFLKNDGTVWTCGNNQYGQLGDGTTTPRNIVAQVASLSGITFVSASTTASLFQKNNGSVWGCGYNNYGQLGDGTTTQRNSPVQCQNLCTVLSSLSISLIQTNISCNGDNNGSATAIASGGSIPYTYSWSTGATTATINNLSVGTYTVTITDSQSNSVTQTVTITQPAVLFANLASNNATCSSCNNGSASAVPAGGTAPYTYSWSPISATTATVSNLLPGNYTCCVTDANGCSTCSGVTVNFNCVAPTTQASNITLTNVTSNSMTVNWTNGNGSRRIVKIKTANSFTAPANGTDYVANPVYLGGEQTVYNGTGNSVTVTGLAPHTLYWFRVYEASCSASSSQYFTSAATGNPKQRITAAASPSNNPNRPEINSEVENEIYFEVFPNPNSGSFKIETSLLNSKIEIFNLVGERIYSAITEPQKDIELKNAATGVYFLRVSVYPDSFGNGERVFMKKLVIE